MLNKLISHSPRVGNINREQKVAVLKAFQLELYRLYSQLYVVLCSISKKPSNLDEYKMQLAGVVVNDRLFLDASEGIGEDLSKKIYHYLESNDFIRSGQITQKSLELFYLNSASIKKMRMPHGSKKHLNFISDVLYQNSGLSNLIQWTSAYLVQLYPSASKTDLNNLIQKVVKLGKQVLSDKFYRGGEFSLALQEMEKILPLFKLSKIQGPTVFLYPKYPISEVYSNDKRIIQVPQWFYSFSDAPIASKSKRLASYNSYWELMRATQHKAHGELMTAYFIIPKLIKMLKSLSNIIEHDIKENQTQSQVIFSKKKKIIRSLIGFVQKHFAAIPSYSVSEKLEKWHSVTLGLETIKVAKGTASKMKDFLKLSKSPLLLKANIDLLTIFSLIENGHASAAEVFIEDALLQLQLRKTESEHIVQSVKNSQMMSVIGYRKNKVYRLLECIDIARESLNKLLQTNFNTIADQKTKRANHLLKSVRAIVSNHWFLEPDLNHVLVAQDILSTKNRSLTDLCLNLNLRFESEKMDYIGLQDTFRSIISQLNFIKQELTNSLVLHNKINLVDERVIEFSKNNDANPKNFLVEFLLSIYKKLPAYETALLTMNLLISTGVKSKSKKVRTILDEHSVYKAAKDVLLIIRAKDLSSLLSANILRIKTSAAIHQLRQEDAAKKEFSKFNEQDKQMLLVALEEDYKSLIQLEYQLSDSKYETPKEFSYLQAMLQMDSFKEL